jgi:hypothetical protein
MPRVTNDTTYVLLHLTVMLCTRNLLCFDSFCPSLSLSLSHLLRPCSSIANDSHVTSSASDFFSETELATRSFLFLHLQILYKNPRECRRGVLLERYEIRSSYRILYHTGVRRLGLFLTEAQCGSSKSCGVAGLCLDCSFGSLAGLSCVLPSWSVSKSFKAPQLIGESL